VELATGASDGAEVKRFMLILPVLSGAKLVRFLAFFDGSHDGLSELVRLLPSSFALTSHTSPSLSSSESRVDFRNPDAASCLPRANMFFEIVCVELVESLRGDNAKEAIDIGEGSAM
jgi:hypothetical protein